MKSKKLSKKLSLSKNTITNLNLESLKKIYGGYEETGPNDPAFTCLMKCNTVGTYCA